MRRGPKKTGRPARVEPLANPAPSGGRRVPVFARNRAQAVIAQRRDSPIHPVLVVVLAAALALTAMLASPLSAHAGARTSTVVENLSVICEPIETDAGSAYLEVGFNGGPSGAFASFAHWPPGAIVFEDPADLETISADVISITSDTLIFDIHVGTIDPDTGEGTELDIAHATVTIALGDTQPIDTKERFGNHSIRRIGTDTDVTATAEVQTSTVRSYSFENCAGHLEEVVELATNPTSFTGHFQTNSLFCDGITNGAGDLLSLSIFQDQSFSDSFVSIRLASDGELIGQAVALPKLGPPDLSLEFQLISVLSGESAGTATLSASLTFESSESALQILAGRRDKIASDRYTVAGTLSTSDGVTFDLASCGFEIFTRSTWRNEQSVQTGGKAPANDTPDNATPLSAHATVNEQIGGGAHDPEVPASCSPFFQFTVWFTVEGTGGPLTVDTAGSKMDSVVAVYTWDGSTFTEVACNDDYPSVEDFFRSLQGKVTFDSEAGKTYYIQAGSFDDSLFGDPDQVGRLRLSIS